MSEPERRAQPAVATSPAASRPGPSLHAVLLIVVLVALIALLLANTRTVEVSWVFGSSRQPLVWIVLVTAVLGWLLGIFTSMLLRHRRAQRS
ncbi:MAG TPA: LapA family protein [Mycobacteriales bacterium]|nr:LapA family protein [Mycobacteriales bacterium]